MIGSLEDARAELRVRLGAGARYDAPSAPARELAWARRGTAYFARILNELDDAALDGPSLISGWSRRHLVAHVGYHARALCRVIAGTRSTEGEPMYPSFAARREQIEHGASLPSRALRHLFQHSEVHLSVEWRDLTDADWDERGADVDGEPFPLRQTPWYRACVVWWGGVFLATGARVGDLPSEMTERLKNILSAPCPAGPHVFARWFASPEMSEHFVSLAAVFASGQSTLEARMHEGGTP